MQASDFLTDKVLNYVLNALPLKQLSPKNTELPIQENIEQVASKLESINPNYSTTLYYNLWLQLASSNYHRTSDLVYLNFLKDLATKTGKKEIIKHNRLKKENIPSEITWKEGNSFKKLSLLEESPYYLLIFWSSTCSHCLLELPKLQRELKENEQAKGNCHWSGR